MNALAIGWDRTVLELKMYFREKEAVFFSFAFPILLLSLFAMIFGEVLDTSPVVAWFGDLTSKPIKKGGKK